MPRFNWGVVAVVVVGTFASEQPANEVCTGDVLQDETTELDADGSSLLQAKSLVRKVSAREDEEQWEQDEYEEDGWCEDGIMNAAGDYCCDYRCNLCSDTLGDQSGMPDTDSSLDSILGPLVSCSAADGKAGDAPPCADGYQMDCTINYVPPPVLWCEDGISGGGACCASSCGRCGGRGCNRRPGGGRRCCSGHITRTSRMCTDKDDTVCKIPCANGVINPAGNYCCDGRCTSCSDAPSTQSHVDVCKADDARSSRTGGSPCVDALQTSCTLSP